MLCWQTRPLPPSSTSHRMPCWEVMFPTLHGRLMRENHRQTASIPGLPHSLKGPWVAALAEGTEQRNDMIYLLDNESKRRTFIVNCNPILGSEGKQGGVLISFDDVTLLEEKEVELRLSTFKGRSRGGQQGQESFPGEHESRDTFTHECHPGFYRGPQAWLLQGQG